MTLARGRAERGYEAWALRLLDELAAHHARPDVATAATHYGAAMTLASELEMRPLTPAAGLGYAVCRDPPAGAGRTTLSTAIAMYQSMDMTVCLPQTETALAWWTRDGHGERYPSSSCYFTPNTVSWEGFTPYNV